MAADFPNSPTLNQEFTVGSRTWKWDGSAWRLLSGGISLALDDLTDTVITSPEEFQTLEYTGTEWTNKHASVVSYVRNAESTTLTTGTAVYLFGSTGDHASVKRADNDSDTTSSKVVGLVGANIAASQNGPVVTRGYVDGIDLSVGYTAGDILWLGEDGGFTKTKPSAPEHLVFIGVVVRATNNGIVYVATQNGYELEELHDVDINPGTLASGDFLKYNGTLWVNDPINLSTDTTGNYVASLVAGTGVTLSNNSGEAATPTVAIGQSVGTTDTVVFGNVNVNAGSVFTGSIDGSTGGLNYITLYTNNGTIDLYGSPSVFGDTRLEGTLTVQAIREKITNGTITSNVLTCSHLDAGVYYITSPSANFTVNVTNLPTTNGFTATVSIFVQQGATGYIPNALQIAGTGQTIKWAGGTTPTPTSSSGKIDLFTFTMIRRSSAWTVLGSANLNY